MAKKKTEWQKLVSKYGVAGAKKRYKKGKKSSTTKGRKKATTSARKKSTTSARKKSTSKGRGKTEWQKLVAQYGIAGAKKRYKKGRKSTASASKKPSKKRASVKRLTEKNCEAIKTHTVSKGYRMTRRKRGTGMGKRRTTKY